MVLGEVARFGSGMIPMRMSSRVAKADDDTGMLDRAVLVEQLGADRADVRQDRVAHHLGQPRAVDNLRVVVEEANKRARAFLDREIVDCGEIVGPGVGQHSNAGIRLDPAR